MSERDPLLHSDSERLAEVDKTIRKAGDEKKLGPREIPRGTRYRILAGIWLATFLSVSSGIFLTKCFCNFQQALNRI